MDLIVLLVLGTWIFLIPDVNQIVDGWNPDLVSEMPDNVNIREQGKKNDDENHAENSSGYMSRMVNPAGMSFLKIDG